MKKIIGLLFLVLIQGCSGVPYQKEKPMSVDQSFWDGRRFIQDNQVVNYSQATSALKADPKSADLMTTAQLMDIGTGLFGTGGGFMIGYGLGSLSRDDGGQPILIATGAASILIAVLFSNSANDKYTQSVEIHNNQLPKSKAKGAGLLISPTGIAFNF